MPAATFTNNLSKSIPTIKATDTTPFKDLLIVVEAPGDLTAGVAENLTVKLSGANPGTLKDPLGGQFDPKTHIFTETARATGTPTAGTTILNRLVYTAPSIPDGTFLTVPVSVSVDNTKANGIGLAGPITLEILTPPGVASLNATSSITSPNTIRPFGGITITDDNLAHDTKDTGVLTIKTADGIPTDSEGTLDNIGVTRTSVGTYTFNPTTTLAFQNNLSQLRFTPAPVSAGATRTTNFSFTVKDVATGLSTPANLTSVQVIGPTPTPVAPLIAGTLVNQKLIPGNAIHPFNAVAISDGNPVPNLRTAIKIIGGGTLAGSDKLVPTAGDPTAYALTATTPDALTTELQKLTFTAPSLDGRTTVTSGITLTVTDATVNLSTTDDKTTIVETVAVDSLGPREGNFKIVNQTTGAQNFDAGIPYPGAFPGLDHQFIVISTDNLNITANVPNSFIKSGSGDDAIDVSHVNGKNVLDGSTGSNFLVGGTGQDTFFLDDRNLTKDVFSTVVNFHAGDNVTIFGVTATDPVAIQNNQGAVGFKGLTYTFVAPGKPNASIVIAGFNTGDLTNGRLSATFGVGADLPGQPGSGSPYLNIHGN